MAHAGHSRGLVTFLDNTGRVRVGRSAQSQSVGHSFRVRGGGWKNAIAGRACRPFRGHRRVRRPITTRNGTRSLGDAEASSGAGSRRRRTARATAPTRPSGYERQLCGSLRLRSAQPTGLSCPPILLTLVVICCAGNTHSWQGDPL